MLYRTGGQLAVDPPPQRSQLAVTHPYKGNLISLISIQEPNGTWRCRYTHIEFPVGSVSLTDYPAGSFPSSGAAEAAGLYKAKLFIDSEIRYE
jgi:hypothetical protein